MSKAGLKTQYNIVNRGRCLTDNTDHLAQMGQLTSVIAHEIRVSLNALFLYGDHLEIELSQAMQWESRAEMMQTVAETKIELTRLHNVVEDYLSLARLTHLHRKPEDVGKLLVHPGKSF